jgi:hypothetical protein
MPWLCFTLLKGSLVLYRRVGLRDSLWTQRLEEYSFASAGDQTPVIQSAVRHYTH